MPRLFPIFGLAIALSSFLAYGIFVGIAFGPVMLDDPAETARLFESRRFWRRIAGPYFVVAVAASSWIAGYTFREAKITSSITIVSLIGSISLVLYFSFLR